MGLGTVAHGRGGAAMCGTTAGVGGPVAGSVGANAGAGGPSVARATLGGGSSVVIRRPYDGRWDRRQDRDESHPGIRAHGHRPCRLVHSTPIRGTVRQASVYTISVVRSTLIPMGEPSYESGPTDVALIDETIPENLSHTIQMHPHREALVSRHQGIRWTYEDFGHRVADLAKSLMHAGLEQGDRFGLWSPNYAEWTLVQFATAEIGVILVNINPAYRTHELEYALKQSGCRWIIAAPEFKTSNYVEMVAEIADSVPSLEHAMFFWTDEWNHLIEGDEHVTDDELAERRGALRPDDPINIQYTSGTTGFPKGATLTHHNILNNGVLRDRAAGLTARRPGLHPGALLPLLRHGDRQPRLHVTTARRW